MLPSALLLLGEGLPLAMLLPSGPLLLLLLLLLLVAWGLGRKFRGCQVEPGIHMLTKRRIYCPWAWAWALAAMLMW